MRPLLTSHGVVVAEDLPLTPLVTGDLPARREAFERIRRDLRPDVEAFAAVHALTVADPPWEPDLADPDLGSALMLHLAGVVSLLPSAGVVQAPDAAVSPLDLINQVLDLEAERHWLYADPGACVVYAPTREAFGDLITGYGAADLVEAAVATATLVGAATLAEAAVVVSVALGVGGHRARAIAGWLHHLYPAPEAGGGWLPALQPDRLGEELLTRVIDRQHRQGIPQARLLPNVLLRHRGSAGEPGLTQAQVHRLFTVLLRAGTRSRDVADLIASPDGATGLVQETPADVDLTVIEAALPRSTRYLQAASVALTRHALSRHDSLHPGWRQHPDTPSGQSVAREGTRLLNNLGIRLSGLGRREEALAATGEAVEIYRRLAVARPDAFEPDLAMSLNNLGAELSGLGRREEALAATEEAVDIYRRLAEANPAAFLPDLASSLNNLGHMLSESGAAGGGAGPDRGSRRPSTGGWPRPTPLPSSPTSPCR